MFERWLGYTWSFPRIAVSIPRMNDMIAIMIINGTAAVMSARRGTNSSMTESRTGPIDPFRVSAEAYCTMPMIGTDATTILPFAVERKSIADSLKVAIVTIK